MKCELLCLVLCLAVAANALPQQVTLVGMPRSFGYPFAVNREFDGTGPTDGVDDGIEGDSSVYDPAAENPFFYSGSLSGMMSSMQAMMIRLRQEMDDLLKRIPQHGEGEESVFGTSDFIPENVKNKTTSKTEVIDGQLYTVNETVITSGIPGANSVFHVKTIQIRPTESTDGVNTDGSNGITDTPQPQITDSSNNGATLSKNDDKNEIPNEKIESTEFNDNEVSLPDHLNEVDASNEVEVFEPDAEHAPIYHDLSKDTLVNDYQRDQGAIMHPDVEYFDVEKLMPRGNDYYRYESQPDSPANENYEISINTQPDKK